MRGQYFSFKSLTRLASYLKSTCGSVFQRKTLFDKKLSFYNEKDAQSTHTNILISQSRCFGWPPFYCMLMFCNLYGIRKWNTTYFIKYIKKRLFLWMTTIHIFVMYNVLDDRKIYILNIERNQILCDKNDYSINT